MDTLSKTQTSNWVKVASTESWPEDGGLAVKLDDTEIAIFNFASRNEWYAISNLCPHKRQMILARGIIGDKLGEPKVACPYHKKQFSLKTGESVDDSSCSSVQVFPVKIEDGHIFVGLA